MCTYMHKQVTIFEKLVLKCGGAGEMKLRRHTALAQNPNSFPSTYVRQLTATHISSFRKSNPSSELWAPTPSCVHGHTQIHICK